MPLQREMMNGANVAAAVQTLLNHKSIPRAAPACTHTQIIISHSSSMKRNLFIWNEERCICKWSADRMTACAPRCKLNGAHAKHMKYKYIKVDCETQEQQFYIIEHFSMQIFILLF